MQAMQALALTRMLCFTLLCIAFLDGHDRFEEFFGWGMFVHVSTNLFAFSFT